MHLQERQLNDMTTTHPSAETVSIPVTASITKDDLGTLLNAMFPGDFSITEAAEGLRVVIDRKDSAQLQTILRTQVESMAAVPSKLTEAFADQRDEELTIKRLKDGGYWVFNSDGEKLDGPYDTREEAEDAFDESDLGESREEFSAKKVAGYWCVVDKHDKPVSARKYKNELDAQKAVRKLKRASESKVSKPLSLIECEVVPGGDGWIIVDEDGDQMEGPFGSEQEAIDRAERLEMELSLQDPGEEQWRRSFEPEVRESIESKKYQDAKDKQEPTKGNVVAGKMKQPDVEANDTEKEAKAKPGKAHPDRNDAIADKLDKEKCRYESRAAQILKELTEAYFGPDLDLEEVREETLSH